MTTRYEAYINGVALSSVAPEIIIDDIQEKQPATDIDYYGIAMGNGSRVLRVARPSLSVSVRFYVRAYDPARRQEVVSDIVKWANAGSQLKISSREGLMLDCIVSGVPYIKSAQKWMEQVTITFTAYHTPYWQEIAPVTATASGASGTMQIIPNGTEPCTLEFEAKNTGSGVMNQFRISADGREMVFEGLAIQAGGILSVALSDGILALPVEKRTAESSDSLIAQPNIPTTISFAADQPVSVTVTARGLYS